MTEQKIKVLYIAGLGRSGSTLLTNLLGQVDGFFAAGEIRWLWEHGLVENEPCSCGENIRNCQVWGEVLSNFFARNDTKDFARMAKTLNNLNRTRNITSLIRGRMDSLIESGDNFISTLEQMYLAISEVTDSKVIIDASKWPTYGYFVENMPSVDPYIVHLIRDSRAVSYSWQRTKNRPENNLPMNIISPFLTSMLWSTWNIATELLWNKRAKRDRYLRLRYEDFVMHPQDTLKKITDFVHTNNCYHIDKSGVVDLIPTHTVSGNPMRFQQTRIEIKPDTEWESRIKPTNKALVSLLTWPLLLRYRYPKKWNQTDSSN
jgi:hypothetical protein